MLLIYHIAIVLLSPALIIWAGLRLWRRGGMTREALRHRFGRLPALPRAPKGRLWLHAVSVGEVGVAALLAPVLLERKPGLQIVLSTTTPTGRRAAEKITGLERIVYMPFDLSPIIRPALARIRPSMIAIIETEIWPALVCEAARRRVPVCIVNGRLSARSHQGYRRLGFFFRAVLGRVRDVLARGEEDAARFRRLGAPAVRVCGNIKFDTPQPDGATPPGGEAASPESWGLGGRGRVIVAGSTHPGEEELIGRAFASLMRDGAADLGLLLAPRHLERVDEVEDALKGAGLTPVRWSRIKEGSGEGCPVVILDAMGELADAYACATLAIIGGSFIPHGGQNPIEAARWAVPCLYGPHMENFEEVARELAACGGAVKVNGEEMLKAAVLAWLDDPAARARAGEAAREVVERSRGAAGRTADYIIETLAEPVEERA